MEDMNINAVIANMGNGNVTTGNVSTGNIRLTSKTLCLAEYH